MNSRLKLFSTFLVFLSRRNFKPKNIGNGDSSLNYSKFQKDPKKLKFLIDKVTEIKKNQNYIDDWVSSEAEVKWMFDHSVKKSQSHSEKETLFLKMVDDRFYRSKPVQYILGTSFFNELELIVRPPTLIPR
eukprot:TRINITY_DN4191_c0_g1_i2.p1 TRINITY_DN4191_c0_g1~~TRINITY_DN4191_c0_g1_i2.p1  ORF type:complete len:131 (-),score=17.38 TRINITY_DN4191_c0_g1_i2:731-1123(-)